MNFTDLYRVSNGFATPLTRLGDLKAAVLKHHPFIEEVVFWECELNEAVSRGHMILEPDRTSPYEDEFPVASIRFASTLNRCWRRFVCTKELMHLFDSVAARANTRTKFFKLMEELESSPLPAESSEMYHSEHNTVWMALIALCPPRLRGVHHPAYVEGRMSDLDVANAIHIPETLIRTLMSTRYEQALERLTGEVLGSSSRRSADVVPMKARSGFKQG